MAKARLRLVETPAEPPLLLTLEQVAARLETGVPEVQAHIKRGLRAYRSSHDAGDLRVAEADLDAYVGRPTTAGRRGRGRPRRTNLVASIPNAYAFLLLERERDIDHVEMLVEAARDAMHAAEDDVNYDRAWWILQDADGSEGVLTTLRQSRALVGALAQLSPNRLMKRDERERILTGERTLVLLCRVIAAMNRRRENALEAIFESPSLIPGDGDTTRIARATLVACRQNSIKEVDAAEMTAIAICAFVQPPTDSDPGNPPASDDDVRRLRVKLWGGALKRARANLRHTRR